MRFKHLIDKNDPATITETHIDPDRIERIDVTPEMQQVAIQFQGRASGVIFMVPANEMDATLKAVEDWHSRCG